MSLNAEDFLKEKFEKLNSKINKHEMLQSQDSSNQSVDFSELTQQQRKGLGSIKASLDDIENGIKLSKVTLDVRPKSPSKIADKCKKPASALRKPNPFIKIVLQKTPDILLFEQRSTTALRDTEEGQLVEEDNKRYAYLTTGAGSRRTRHSIETQTSGEFLKTRAVNTEQIPKATAGSYVSNFEMFDTYKDLEKTTQDVVVNAEQKMQVTTYKVGGKDQFIEINELSEFKLALMLTMRILAGNTFEQQQRRFRNMTEPDPLALEVRYRYRLERLWTFNITKSASEKIVLKGHAISDMSWCPVIGDILAVGYGCYNTPQQAIPPNGYVCIWNIKNPVNPERIYIFKSPVMTVEFCPFVPQLLAIGLYDGSSFVYDISKSDMPEVAMSQQSSSTAPSCEPIISVKWIAHSKCETKLHNIESFLALSRDSRVTRYTIINSPHLLGFQQMFLDRVEVNPEGLQVEKKAAKTIQANRHPQGLDICLDSLDADVYYLLTDEGCQHKCSTNYPQQHMQVLKLHEAGVNYMEFSPWSSKLYLTCGNDWCIRIWLIGIYKPLITLSYHMGPVHCASWSLTHSTIIIAIGRRTLDVWDLKRSILKPASTTKPDDANVSFTQFKLSHCGRSVVVGNTIGTIDCFSFEDMPFSPHFQYDHLRDTIYAVLTNEQDLLQKVKSIGYFGYPDKKKI